MIPGQFDNQLWEPGVVYSIGQPPYLRDSQGKIVRFAYRNVKRFGQPKRMISVGDRVDFVRDYPPRDDKALQVRLLGPAAGGGAAQPRAPAPVVRQDPQLPEAVRMALPVPESVAAAAAPLLPVAQSDRTPLSIVLPAEASPHCAQEAGAASAALTVNVSWPTPSTQSGAVWLPLPTPAPVMQTSPATTALSANVVQQTGASGHVSMHTAHSRDQLAPSSASVLTSPHSELPPAASPSQPAATLVVPIAVRVSGSPAAQELPNPDMAYSPMSPSAAHDPASSADKSNPASAYGTAPSPAAESEPATDITPVQQALPAAASAVPSPLSPSSRWVHDPYSCENNSRAVAEHTG